MVIDSKELISLFLVPLKKLKKKKTSNQCYFYYFVNDEFENFRDWLANLDKKWLKF